MTKYAYEMTLDKGEFDTLCWASNRGYDAGMLEHAHVTSDDDQTFLLEWEEHKAWMIQEAFQEDPDAALNPERAL